jgi:hypothetical protein
MGDEVLRSCCTRGMLAVLCGGGPGGGGGIPPESIVGRTVGVAGGHEGFLVLAGEKLEGTGEYSLLLDVGLIGDGDADSCSGEADCDAVTKGRGSTRGHDDCLLCSDSWRFGGE